MHKISNLYPGEIEKKKNVSAEMFTEHAMR